MNFVCLGDQLGWRDNILLLLVEQVSIKGRDETEFVANDGPITIPFSFGSLKFQSFQLTEGDNLLGKP